MKRIEKRALLLWRLRLTLAAAPCPLFVALFFSGAPVWHAILTFLWVALYTGLFLFYYPIKYHRLRYGLNGRSLVVHCGVFYRNIKSIDLKNIQYVTSGATPLQHLMGLRTVLVSCAGGRIPIPGITPAHAAALCQRLAEGQGKGGHAG